jgi:hypothetical protein
MTAHHNITALFTPFFLSLVYIGDIGIGDTYQMDILDDLMDIEDTQSIKDNLNRAKEATGKLTKEERSKAALLNTAVIRADYPTTFNISIANVTDAKSFKVVNELEFLKWASYIAMTQPYTPLGESMAKILLREYIKDKAVAPVKQAVNGNLLMNLKVSVMAKLARREIKMSQITIDDYDNINVVEGQIVGDQVGDVVSTGDEGGET